MTRGFWDIFLSFSFFLFFLSFFLLNVVYLVQSADCRLVVVLPRIQLANVKDLGWMDYCLILKGSLAVIFFYSNRSL